MPESRQTPSSLASRGWEWWWMVPGLLHNLFCFNTRLSCPSSSPDLRLNTLKYLCFFHNASISIASPASFNIVHYWREHRKPITQVAAGVGHVPTQPHRDQFSVQMNENPHTLPSPSPVLRLLGAATDTATHALDIHIQLMSTPGALGGPCSSAGKADVHTVVKSKDFQNTWVRILSLLIKLCDLGQIPNLQSLWVPICKMEIIIVPTCCGLNCAPHKKKIC